MSDPTLAAAPATDSAPLRRLGVRHAIAVSVGMVVGAGIFKSAPEVAANVDSDAVLFAAWLIGGLFSLIGALCFAEMAAAFADTGGDYHFLYRAYGRRLAFAFAWSRFAVIHSGSMAMLAFVFGDYLAQVVPLGPYGSAVFAASAIAALTVLNLSGVRVGVGTQVGLVGLVVLGLLAVVVAGVSLAMSGQAPVASAAVGGGGIAPFGVAMVFVLLAYGGWSDAATLSAEMRDPRRGMLYALLGGMGLVTVLYLLVNWAFWRGLGLGGLALSNAPAADLMRLAFGRSGELLIVAVVAVTSISVINALMIAGSRTIYAAARDLPALARIGVWNRDRGVPPMALLAQGGFALLLVLFAAGHRGFATMVDYLSPVYWFFLMLSAIAVIRLRRRYPTVPRPFKVPLYPWLPIAFALNCAYLLHASLVYVRTGAVVGVAVMLFGVGLAWLLEWFGGARDRAAQGD